MLFINVGQMYENGHGVPQEYSKAVDWYQKAANQGHAIAQHNLGSMYKCGQGVAQDHFKAVEWYQKAASQGEVVAQKDLGEMYADVPAIRNESLDLDTDSNMWFNVRASSSEMIIQKDIDME
ncbi:hypothetical protein BGX26_009247 [Mortierella sp. AD094]|nr:hypothetical protein BGX26_009247 [Mortierella sp. AD094]